MGGPLVQIASANQPTVADHFVANENAHNCTVGNQRLQLGPLRSHCSPPVTISQMPATTELEAAVLSLDWSTVAAAVHRPWKTGVAPECGEVVPGLHGDRHRVV